MAYPGETFQGRIVSITPLLEAATRTLKARALVGNPEGKLKLEMFANVRINYDLGEKLAVPDDAVMHAGTRRERRSDGVARSSLDAWLRSANQEAEAPPAAGAPS